MSELLPARIAVVALVVAVLAGWAMARVAARRRQARFEALARSLGSTAVRDGEFLLRFTVELAERTFEVRYQHLGSSGGAGGPSGWYLVSSARLQGVSALHSVDVGPRSRRDLGRAVAAGDLASAFIVRDAGYPLREGWLTAAVGRALAEFYALDLPLGALALEEAALVHRLRRSLRGLGGSELRELLSRQAAVASALERVV